MNADARQKFDLAEVPEDLAMTLDAGDRATAHLRDSPLDRATTRRGGFLVWRSSTRRHAAEGARPPRPPKPLACRRDSGRASDRGRNSAASCRRRGTTPFARIGVAVWLPAGGAGSGSTGSPWRRGKRPPASDPDVRGVGVREAVGGAAIWFGLGMAAWPVSTPPADPCKGSRSPPSQRRRPSAADRR